MMTDSDSGILHVDISQPASDENVKVTSMEGISPAIESVTENIISMIPYRKLFRTMGMIVTNRKTIIIFVAMK